MKKIYLVTLCILLLILFSFNITAIGVKPIQRTFEYSGMNELNGEFRIVNNNVGNLVSCIVYAEGDLKDYIIFESRDIKFTDLEKSVKYKVILPNNLLPGTISGTIYIEEVTSDIYSSNMIARVKIGHKVNVNMPYPDRFVILDLDVINYYNESEIIAIAENKGNSTIDLINYSFKLFENSKIVANIHDSQTNFSGKSSIVFKHKVHQNNLLPGQYISDISLIYDNTIVSILKNITFGKFNLVVIESEKYFEVSKINEFPLVIHNNWNKDSNNVFYEVKILNNTKIISEFKSPSFDISSRNNSKIISYFDTRPIEIGKYVANVTVVSKSENFSYYLPIEILDSDNYSKKKLVSSLSLEKIYYLIFSLFVFILVLVLIIVYLIDIVKKTKKKRK